MLLLGLESLFCLELLALFHLQKSLLLTLLSFMLDDARDLGLLSPLFSLLESLNPFLLFIFLQASVGFCHATSQLLLIIVNCFRSHLHSLVNLGLFVLCELFAYLLLIKPSLLYLFLPTYRLIFSLLCLHFHLSPLQLFTRLNLLQALLLLLFLKRFLSQKMVCLLLLLESFVLIALSLLFLARLVLFLKPTLVLCKSLVPSV